MKNYILILLLLALTSCKGYYNKKTSEAQGEELLIEAYEGYDSLNKNWKYIQYKGEINGYKVGVYYEYSREPSTMNRLTHTRKSAFIFFKYKDGSRFEVVTNSFNYSHIEYQDVTSDYSVSEYEYPHYDFNKAYNLNDELSIATGTNLEESPFFFGDVDFDGEDELIVCGYKIPRYNLYNCYDIEMSSSGRNAKLLTVPPFIHLVGRFSKFDKENKIIETWSRSGDYDNYKIINNGTETTSIVIDSGNYNTKESQEIVN